MSSFKRAKDQQPAQSFQDRNGDQANEHCGSNAQHLAGQVNAPATARLSNRFSYPIVSILRNGLRRDQRERQEEQRMSHRPGVQERHCRLQRIACASLSAASWGCSILATIDFSIRQVSRRAARRPIIITNIPRRLHCINSSYRTMPSVDRVLCHRFTIGRTPNMRSSSRSGERPLPSAASPASVNPARLSIYTVCSILGRLKVDVDRPQERPTGDQHVATQQHAAPEQRSPTARP